MGIAVCYVINTLNITEITQSHVFVRYKWYPINPIISMGNSYFSKVCIVNIERTILKLTGFELFFRKPGIVYKEKLATTDDI